MTRRTVAVGGGGCSGVLAARELLRCTDDDVVLIEPGEPGGGRASGAAAPWPLLNSRAGAMSADPDDPGHFARWAGAAPHEFRSRLEYGRYLRDVFADAAASYPDRLDVRPDRVAAVHPDGTVILASGHPVRAENVVLATGNPAAAHPARTALENGRRATLAAASTALGSGRDATSRAYRDPATSDTSLTGP